MSYLKLKGISKSYGTTGRGRAGIDGITRALKSVDLDVYEHQIMVVLGPSGCGKSTLIRVVAGLETPDAGRVFLSGKDITDESPRDRNIAMVFQDYALYPHMTAEKNLTFGLITRGMGRREAAGRARDAAGLLGISALLKKKPGQLSGGERQRVALGRAIVKKPRLFLMDEPLSNVDALLRAKMRSEIARIIKEVNGTMILVTHDQTEAMTMGDVLAVMKEGAIEQVGTPREIYGEPKNIFIARFIGSPEINLIEPGTRLHDSITKTIGGKGGAGGKKSINRAAGFSGEYKNVIFGIRPEDIFSLAEDKGRGRKFEGEVRFVEELGYESHVTVAFFDVDVKVRMGVDKGATPPTPGETIAFSFEEGELYLFDKSTGNRIE